MIDNKIDSPWSKQEMQLLKLVNNEEDQKETLFTKGAI